MIPGRSFCCRSRSWRRLPDCHLGLFVSRGIERDRRHHEVAITLQSRGQLRKDHFGELHNEARNRHMIGHAGHRCIATSSANVAQEVEDLHVFDRSASFNSFVVAGNTCVKIVEVGCRGDFGTNTVRN